MADKKKLDTLEVSNLTVDQVFGLAEEAAEETKIGPGGEEKAQEQESLGAYYDELIQTVRGCYDSLDLITLNNDIEALDEQEDRTSFTELKTSLMETLPVLNGSSTGSYVLTDTSVSEPAALATIPAIYGLGAAVLANMFNKTFGEGSAFAAYIGAKAATLASGDSEEGGTPPAYKGFFKEIGSDIQGLGLGLVAIAASAIAFGFVNPASAGVMLLYLGALGLGIGLISVMSKELRETFKSDAEIQAFGESVNNVGKALLYSAGAIIAAALAGQMIANNPGMFILGLSATIVTCGILLLGAVYLTELNEDVDTEGIEAVGQSLKNVGLALLYSEGAILAAALIGMFIGPNMISGLMLTFAVMAAMFVGIMAVMELSEDADGEGIKAVGETIKQIGITLLIVQAVILVSAILVGTGLLQMALPGLAVTFGIMWFIFHEVGALAEDATDEKLKTIKAIGITMLEIGVMVLLIGITMAIVGSINWTPQSLIAVGMMFGFIILLFHGLDEAIEGLGDLEISDILKATLVLAVATIVIVAVGAIVARVAEAGDPGTILAAVGAIAIMLGLVIIMGVAMAVMGQTLTTMIPYIAAGALVAVIVAGAVGLTILLMTACIAAAIQQFQNAGVEDPGDMIAWVGNIALLLGLVAVMALGVVAIAGIGILAVALAPIAILSVIALGMVIPVLMEVIQTIKLPEGMEIEEVTKNVAGLASIMGLMAVFALSIALATPLLILGSIFALMSFGPVSIIAGYAATVALFATSIRTIVEADVKGEDVSKALSTLRLMGRFASGIGWTAITLLWAVRSLSSLDLSDLETAKQSIAEMIEFGDSIPDLVSTTEDFSELGDAVENMNFNLWHGLKLRGALMALQMAFGGGGGLFGFITGGQVDFEKPIDQVNRFAENLTKLTEAADPVYRLAAAIRDVSAAAGELNEADLSGFDQIADSMQGAAEIGDKLAATAKALVPPPDPWKEAMEERLANMAELLEDISKNTRGTYKKTAEAAAR